MHQKRALNWLRKASIITSKLIPYNHSFVLLKNRQKSRSKWLGFQGLEDTNPSTQRLLFRKIIKGFGEQESVLASHSYRIQSLEVQLEKARPRKRMKVRTSPNSRFGGIEQIRRTQLAVGEAIFVDNDEEKSNKPDITLDCIEIE